MRMTPADIAHATHGRLEYAPGRQEVTGVSTDSRIVHSGDLFVALKGERFDGHDFVAEAFSAGAVAALVSREGAELPAGKSLIFVDDTLIAYGRLATWHRRQFDTTVVAVTGSAGKTTTKNMIGSILARHGPTRTAPRTENNAIGVPRVLLSLDEQHQYCVVELAMRGPGEIDYLAQLTQPQVGVITNISQTHLGRLGSREAIAQAKAELLHVLPETGMAILNADDFYYGLFAEMAPCRVVSFGATAGAQVRISDVHLHGLEGSDFSLEIDSEVILVSAELPGMHNVFNAAAAAAAAWAVTDSTAHIAQGIANCPTEEMRTEIRTSPSGATIINDAYNASPSSVAAALELVGQLAGRKIFVFGDMLELGDAAEKEHRLMGQLCAEKGIDWLITIGRWASVAAEEAEQLGLRTDIVQDAEEAVNLLAEKLSSDDVVLVKASRDLALERVAKGLSDHA